MSIANDSSEEQKAILLQILEYSLDGIRKDMDWKWKVALYADVCSFLHRSAVEDNMPSNVIGSLSHLEQWLISEYEALSHGKIN